MKKLILLLFIMLFGFSYAIGIDDKISQMIIVGFDGNSLKSKEFRQFLKNVNDVSGVILFNKNIDNIKEINAMIQSIKDNSKIPPFIAIDNEEVRF